MLEKALCYAHLRPTRLLDGRSCLAEPSVISNMPFGSLGSLGPMLEEVLCSTKHDLWWCTADLSAISNIPFGSLWSPGPMLEKALCSAQHDY